MTITGPVSLACPHFPACAGCPWVGQAYGVQLRAKRERVRAALVAALPPSARPEVRRVIPSPVTTGYRVQTKLVVRATRSGPLLGLYHPGTHRVVDTTRCPLHHSAIRHALPIVRDALAAEAIPIHGAAESGVRYLLMRASVSERRLLVTLVSSRVPLPRIERLTHRLRRRIKLAGLLVNENTSTGNVIVGERTQRMWGDATLRERYGRLLLAAGPVAFVQANTRVATLIYRAIASAAALRPDERVLDLYCGVGGIALTLAAEAGTVVGIEEIAAAVHAARENAHRNRLSNARFESGRVEDVLPGIAPRSVDVVTMNPPRRGCGEAVARSLLALGAPRLFYLSCSPESFARDAVTLVSGGYALAQVVPFDLMPHTDHVELLGAFVRSVDGRPPHRPLRFRAGGRSGANRATLDYPGTCKYPKQRRTVPRGPRHARGEPRQGG